MPNNEQFYPNATYETARDDPANAEFFAAMDTLADALNKLGKLDADDAGEAIQQMDGTQLSPVVVGQVLLNVLPFPDNSRLDIEAKKYWMEVAAILGPDWIGSLRKIAAFMDKVDQF